MITEYRHTPNSGFPSGADCDILRGTVDTTPSYLGIGIGVGFFLGGILFLIAVFRLGRGLWRACARLAPAFGDTIQARLIGLGVAVFFFPGLVTGPADA